MNNEHNFPKAILEWRERNKNLLEEKNNLLKRSHEEIMRDIKEWCEDVDRILRNIEDKK